MLSFPFEKTPHTGSIEFVATAPKRRGKGTAHGLLLYVMEMLPYEEYVLEVVIHNAPAVKLYEKFRFFCVCGA